MVRCVRRVFVSVGPMGIGRPGAEVFTTVNQVLVRLCARRFGRVFPDHARCPPRLPRQWERAKGAIAFLTDGWVAPPRSDRRPSPGDGGVADRGAAARRV